ncbi:MAG: cobalt ECF transporter T component CbiQ [Clostridium sp.]
MAHKHENVYSIDFYAYHSKLRALNPGFKVLLTILILLLCIMADSPIVSTTVILSMGYLTVVKGHLSFSRYLSLLTIPISFMLIGSIAIAVGVAGEPTGDCYLNLHLFYLYVTKNSMIRALQLMLKAFGAVSATYMLVLSTPAGEIISVLRQLHIPKLVIELMNMIYRFIFILMDVQCSMRHSAESRLGYCDFKTSCLSFGRTAGNLLLLSLKKANTYYDALISRCYDGELLFLEEEKKVTGIQVAAACVYLSLLIILWYFTV